MRLSAIDREVCPLVLLRGMLSYPTGRLRVTIAAAAILVHVYSQCCAWLFLPQNSEH